MNKSIKIPKGTRVHYSERGYYNFYYPSYSFIVLTEDVTVQKLNWLGGGPLKAYKILGAPEKNVVWTEEKNILHLETGTN